MALRDFLWAVTAALISAKLLQFELKTIAQRDRYCGFDGGYSQNIGNMTMSLHAGNASRNGILIAAKFAKKGFTGGSKYS